MAPFYQMTSVSTAEGNTKTTSYVGVRQKLYHRNKLSNSMLKNKLLCMEDHLTAKHEHCFACCNALIARSTHSFRVCAGSVCPIVAVASMHSSD